MAILMFLLALWVSNRLVGPVPRLRSAMQQVSRGDYSARLKFRPEDLLGSIAEEFNQMADALQRRHAPPAPVRRGSDDGDATAMAEQIAESVLRQPRMVDDSASPPPPSRS